MSVNLNTSHRIIPTQINPSDYIKTVSVDADRLGVLELKDGKKFKISVSEISPNTLDQFTQKDWENVAQQTVAVLIKQGVLENFAGANFNSEGMRTLSGEIIPSQPSVAADIEEMVKDLLATKEKIEKVVSNIQDVVVSKEESKKILNDKKITNRTSTMLKALAAVALGCGAAASIFSSSAPVDLLNAQITRNAGALIGGAALIADGCINRKNGLIGSKLSMIAGTALIGASFMDRAASNEMKKGWELINKDETNLPMPHCVQNNNPFECPLTALYHLDKVERIQEMLSSKFMKDYGRLTYEVDYLSPFIHPNQPDYHHCFERGALTDSQVYELNRIEPWTLTTEPKSFPENATRFDCYKSDPPSSEGEVNGGARTSINLCTESDSKDRKLIKQFLGTTRVNKNELMSLAEQKLAYWSISRNIFQFSLINERYYNACKKYYSEANDALFGRVEVWPGESLNRWGQDKGFLSYFKMFY